MEKYAVYGLGHFFEQNKKELFENWNIDLFIDNNKHGVVGTSEIQPKVALTTNKDCIVILMFEDVQTCYSVARELEKDFGFSEEKIVFGIDIVSNWKKKRGIERISYAGEGHILLEIEGFKCKIGSIDEYNNVIDVLVNKVYQYHINNTKKDVVIDIGMNIGDSTWFFLNMPSVSKVYAYEPFLYTYNTAMDNLETFINSETLCCNNYGLSDVTETRTVQYNKDMSCGMSSISSITMEAKQRYKDLGLTEAQNDVTETIQVKRASEIFGKIITDSKNYNYVLKMDCEGEEYRIVDDLYNNGMLSLLDFVMIEWHYAGSQPLIEKLEKSGFSWWGSNENTDMGLIFAFKGMK